VLMILCKNDADCRREMAVNVGYQKEVMSNINLHYVSVGLSFGKSKVFEIRHLETA
jgi:hypothetical protein